MYKIAKIKFYPLIDSRETQLDSLSRIISGLLYNGQIMKNYVTEDCGDHFTVTVTVVGEEALLRENCSSYTCEYLENFEIEYEIHGRDPFASDFCHCEKHSHLILFHEPRVFSSPVICGDCGWEIPLYRLAQNETNDENFKIVMWQDTYDNVCELYINSLSDRFTKRQIRDCNSQLNKLGAQTCKQIEERTGIPTYLFINNPMPDWYSRRKESAPLSHCPKCKGELRVIYKNSANKMCPECRFAFGTEFI